MQVPRHSSGLLLLVLLLTLLETVCNRACAQTLISGLGKGAIPLEGKWRFHPGDEIAWSKLAFDDSGWTTITADLPWTSQGYPGYYGFAWYRIHITCDATYPESLSLLVSRLDDAYEVYWNGTLVGHYGALPPHPVWFSDQLPQIFTLGGARSGVLAFRVWRAPPLSDDPGAYGGFADAPLIGTAAGVDDARERLNYTWLRTRQFLFTENLVYGLIALLSFIGWIRRRNQLQLLWITAFTGVPILSLLLLRIRLQWPYTVTLSLDQPLTAIRDVALWFLLLWLLELDRFPALVRAARIFAVSVLIINLLDGIVCAVYWHPALLRPCLVIDATIAVIDTALSIFPLALVIVALKHPRHLSPEKVALAISAFLLEMMIVVSNAFAQGSRYTHWTVKQHIFNPILVIWGSAISPLDIAELLLLACIVYAVMRVFFEEKKRQGVFEQEMQNARELQRALVPEGDCSLDGFVFSTEYRPAQHVGGDFFQTLHCRTEPGPALFIVLGDVSGKGLKAAMAVSFLVGAVRALAERAAGPAELLTLLNEQLADRMQGGFVTCLVLLLRADGRCTAATAGHPAPFVNKTEIPLEGALPLGLIPRVGYTDYAFQLLPGDTCTAFSDGVLEARNRSGDLFGYARLAEVVAQGFPASRMAQAAADFGQDDDITVFMLKRSTEARTAADSRSAAALQPAPTGTLA